MFSDAYVEHLAAGPFAGRVDPWAEDDHYFQQIHAGVLDHILQEIQPRLRRLGYRAGREASLQILGGREPDIFVQRIMNRAAPSPPWDYALAAEEMLIDPGFVISADVTLQAIHIHENTTQDLVTILELISPGNKLSDAKIAAYQHYREDLVIRQKVNIMEIDLTRSKKRLLSNRVVDEYAYHVVVYLPNAAHRLIGMAFDVPLKRVALPLRAQVLPIELQTAYEYAYRNAGIADQLLAEKQYVAAHLPFSSLLTDDQKHACLQRVADWQTKLTALSTP